MPLRRSAPISSGKRKESGITPTTVRAWPPIFTVLPTIFASALKLFRHKPSDSSTTSGPPAKPSASLNVRPSKACAPNIENMLVVTRGATTLSDPSRLSITLVSYE